MLWSSTTKPYFNILTQSYIQYLTLWYKKKNNNTIKKIYDIEMFDKLVIMNIFTQFIYKKFLLNLYFTVFFNNLFWILTKTHIEFSVLCTRLNTIQPRPILTMYPHYINYNVCTQVLPNNKLGDHCLLAIGMLVFTLSALPLPLIH